MPETADDLERWRALRAQFVNVTDPKKACRLPTPADIERLEAEIGFRLPAGYRGFTQVFGPGTLIVGEEGLRFYAPYAPEKPPAGSPGYSLLREAQQARESGRSVVGDGPRFYRFAGDSDSNVYGWVVDDVVNSESPEYGVYCCRRFDDAFVKMARTFEGFIRLFTNQTEYRKRSTPRSPTRTSPTRPSTSSRGQTGRRSLDRKERRGGCDSSRSRITSIDDHG